MRISDWSSDVCSSDLLTREEKSIVIGVIPSEGTKSYGGKVIAYSPGNDLALIQLEEGSIPTDTFYSGAVQDGQPVTAIGYPGTVDRAQGLDLQDMIEPLTPVKSRSEEHTSELQSLMRISYAVFCLKKKKQMPTADGQTTLLTRSTHYDTAMSYPST